MGPYKENKLEDNEYIREFDSNLSQEELEWHLDKEDRIVESIKNDNWQFQMDNELPIVLTRTFVPKETYHRLIKGNGNLLVKITKLKQT